MTPDPSPAAVGAVQAGDGDGASGGDGGVDDDAALLARHVAGDPNAFGELADRHASRLWAVALRTVGDPDEAADAVQEALISAFRRADSFRGDSKVTTWLHRIVVNACLDRLRRRKVRQADPLPDEPDRLAELAGPESAADPAEERERRLDVMAALNQLSSDQRSALVLVDMEGYGVDEAAQLLGCAPGTVKSRCARGRARLAPLLRHWDPAVDPLSESPESPPGGPYRPREPGAPEVRPSREDGVRLRAVVTKSDQLGEEGGP